MLTRVFIFSDATELLYNSSALVQTRRSGLLLKLFADEVLLKSGTELQLFFSWVSLTKGQEENKILYFHPDLSLSQKLKQIGLAEALNAVSKSFSGNCEALRTKKFTHAFLEPEQDFLISLSIKNGDTQYSHALLLSGNFILCSCRIIVGLVLNDWYELFMRVHGQVY